ncbi:UPF0175 family protein [Haliovirga abyssi]|uniref:Uncharacterized protein n=1 Tax=Haliovirga abyssi TaxID=2996794 RepID=A0AAU9DNV1_9FUSO|nr:UPF0175 family protein [Haliovirga abyssi]BDU50053.1 hypothetical protein HLVA_06220 [Haliovirga abyssi]
MLRKSKLEFPEEILFALRENENFFLKEIKVIAAVNYYKEKRLSVGQAAELAEMSEEEFIKYLGGKKISIFQFENEEELLEDIKNA